MSGSEWHRQITKETGVSYATILNWREKYRPGKRDMDDADSLTPDQRNPEEKPTLLLESKTLSDAHGGEWLRQHG